jgi:uncharacterized protein
MTTYLIVSLAAFVTALLTFFSGFGLGTILTPVFALFFPIELAIALTGVVHFFNNVFKLLLTGRAIDWPVLLRFGLPAVGAALVGAWLLLHITDLPPLYRYTLGTRSLEVTPVKLVISLLLIGFALLDLLPPLTGRLRFGHEKLAWGGLLSGFFGGLSGHQGALRSAFLIRSGLSKEAYVATAIAIACFIDFTRIAVYATRFANTGLRDNLGLVLSATLAAMAGALLGNRLLRKVTLELIQKLVAVLLLLISVALASGLL